MTDDRRLTTDVYSLPPPLREAVSRDLRAVKPLAAPWRRTIWLLPIGVVLLFAAMFIFGLRRDAPELGIALTWTASVLETFLGLVLVAAALREAIPGTTLARRVVGTVGGTVFVVVVGITWLTWLASPTVITTHVARIWGICLAGTILSAMPALAVAGWLAARAFPLRPPVAGALYGIGAGLMADAGWRLFCHFSDPVHVFGAHVLGILAAGLIGIVLARATHATR